MKEPEPSTLSDEPEYIGEVTVKLSEVKDLEPPDFSEPEPSTERCLRTGNPVGTDTMREGETCPCANCTPSTEAAGFDEWWDSHYAPHFSQMSPTTDVAREAWDAAYEAGQSSSLEALMIKHEIAVGYVCPKIGWEAYAKDELGYGDTPLEAVTSLLEQIEDNNNAT